MAHKAEPAAAKTLTLTLPLLVASPADVGRLEREMEIIEETFLQLGLRHAGTDVKIPKTSQLLDQTVELNKLNLLKKEDRAVLKQYLTAVHERAPVLHISFSADPSPVFIEKLMTWLRREINPHVLISIGLQPSIGAGCVVRTRNKYFDFSLRQDFADKRDLLLAELVVDKTPPPPQAQPPVQTPTSAAPPPPPPPPPAVPAKAAA